MLFGTRSSKIIITRTDRVGRDRARRMEVREREKGGGGEREIEREREGGERERERERRSHYIHGHQNLVLSPYNNNPILHM